MRGVLRGFGLGYGKLADEWEKELSDGRGEREDEEEGNGVTM